ncbi:MAG: 5'/3'-nucleotidase SurE [Spirochaetales bacterium]|nr:5'/3'-nucleotidase SurE [Spirochaetales bacterium]
MRILLSNDDGILSPGLAAVRTAIEDYWGKDTHELWVIAPDGERSGQSHSITLKEPIRARQIGPRQFQISGTPADCVVTAVLGIMPEKPDLVISGVNVGPNLGTDITYSGTAAVARQAAYMGIPGVALSLGDYHLPYHFEPIAKFAAAHIDLFVSLADSDHFLNINAPNHPDYPVEARVTHPCRRMYNDRMLSFEAPRGDTYYFLDGTPIDSQDEIGSDWDVVNRGYVSLTPIHLHPVKNEIEKVYKEALEQ